MLAVPFERRADHIAKLYEELEVEEQYSPEERQLSIPLMGFRVPVRPCFGEGNVRYMWCLRP